MKKEFSISRFIILLRKIDHLKENIDLRAAQKDKVSSSGEIMTYDDILSKEEEDVLSEGIISYDEMFANELFGHFLRLEKSKKIKTKGPLSYFDYYDQGLKAWFKN